jgi:hypothetical protein
VLSFFSRSIRRAAQAKKITSPMGAHWAPLSPPCPLVHSAQQSFVGLETSFFGLESRFSRPKKVDPLVDRRTAERELFIPRNGGNQQWC